MACRWGREAAPGVTGAPTAASSSAAGRGAGHGQHDGGRHATDRQGHGKGHEVARIGLDVDAEALDHADLARPLLAREPVGGDRLHEHAAGARLGLDLERIEARGGSFLEDWFTPTERAFVEAAIAGEAALRTTLVWSAKESVMKALREGLRIAPRDVEAVPAAGPADGLWRPFGARGPGAAEWSGWWRAEEGFVLSVVADPPSDPPERIG